jgi:hypothetical protein
MNSSVISRIIKAFFLSIFFVLNIPSSVYAQAKNFDPARHEIYNDVPTIRGFEVIVANLLTIVISLAGIILFIMFVIGGFKYLTSSGDPKQTEAAKGTLTHAIAGLAVIIFGYLFIQLVTKITGVDLSIFQVYKP